MTRVSPFSLEAVNSLPCFESYKWIEKVLDCLAKLLGSAVSERSTKNIYLHNQSVLEELKQTGLFTFTVEN